MTLCLGSERVNHPRWKALGCFVFSSVRKGVQSHLNFPASPAVLFNQGRVRETRSRFVSNTENTHARATEDFGKWTNDQADRTVCEVLSRRSHRKTVFIEGVKHVDRRLRFSAQERLPSDNVAQDHGKHCHGAEGELAQPKLFRRHSLAGF